MDGKKIAGPGNPFSEIGLHLAAYRSRPDTVAVVHAHPPYATARGACGLALDKPFVPESVVSLGDNIPVATFAMPGSPENEKMVSSLLQCSNVIMLAGNGVLAIGTDAMQAYLRLELVEHLAKMDFIANRMGRPFELSAGDRAKLLEKREKAGLATPLTSASAPTGPDPDQERLIKIITEEVASILGK
jgi:L-fuculose-phosphate aldolase